MRLRSVGNCVIKRSLRIVSTSLRHGVRRAVFGLEDRK
jgi:hypothetical protein